MLAPAAEEHNLNNHPAMGAVTIAPLSLPGPAAGTAASDVLGCSDNAITRSVPGGIPTGKMESFSTWHSMALAHLKTQLLA